MAAAPALNAARAPELLPSRLDFPALWNGEAKKLTIRFKSPAPGNVSAKLSDRNFRISELRAMGGGLMTGGGPVGALLPSGAPATREPFEKSVAAGQEIQVDVVFEPKFSLENVAGAKAATLVLAGPGAPANWRVDVPVAGRFEGIKLSLVFKADGTAFDVVEPDNRLEVPVTLLAFGQDVSGVFRSRKAPAGFVLEEKPFVAKAGTASKTTLVIRLEGVWLGRNSNRPGGEVRVAFEYAGKATEAVFEVWPHTRTLEVRTVSFAPSSRPGCDAAGIEGLVRISSDGSITMGMWWAATSWKADPARALLVQATFDGKPYAEGIYPKSQQSAYYGIPGPLFRTTFRKQDYLSMDKAFGYGHYGFVCKDVAATSHF